MNLLPSETVLTGENPQYSIIWLHGLGADGHDFVSLVPELKLPKKLAVKFIFPHAPVRAVTLNNGMQMRAWYDLLSLERGKTADEADILKTVKQINRLIQHEVATGISADKIILAGFSQGGVIALHTALRYPKRLAGIMALSTYLPFAENAFRQMSAQQKGLDIFAAHGTQDPVIPVLSWQDYVPKLKAQGFVVDAHEYPMEHSLCLDEVEAISRWIQKVFD